MPSSSPARCVSRGTMSMRQQKCSAPRGAVRTHMFSGGLRAEAPPEAPQRVVQQRRAGRAVVLEAGPRPPRREHQLVGQPRRVRRQQDGLVVDRDDPLAAA